MKVWLAEGAPISATSEVARMIEELLVDHSPVPGAPEEQLLRNVVTFIGTGGPRLMLTQEPEYDYPYYALLLVNTTDPGHTEAYAQSVRKRLAQFVTARITADEFMLGPPIKDPVAFRLSGPDGDVIAQKAREMVRIFKETPGTVHPYSNWGAPAYQVEMAIKPEAANLAGVTNADIALTTIGGLLPLSLFGGALWAPMTNSMIFGLIVSTGLTLFVIPSLYVLFAERLGMRVILSPSANEVTPWPPAVRSGLESANGGFLDAICTCLIYWQSAGSVRWHRDRRLTVTTPARPLTGEMR